MRFSINLPFSVPALVVACGPPNLVSLCVSQMWISWSWSSGNNDDEDVSFKFKDHPVLSMFEKSNVLSRIEVTRLQSKRRLCFNQDIQDYNPNRATDLPLVLWECNDLEKLFLSRNAIKQLPVEISNLENLTVLSLANNCFESFPEEVTFLVQLKWLNLSGNLIPVIPGSIQRIRYLEVFWCNNSKVAAIDDNGIGFCYHLNTLGLRGNVLQRIPDTLSQLTNLAWLTLENNQISSLPSSMALLANLTHLNVQNNCIERVPEFLNKMRCLKYVFLNSNRIKAVHLMDLYHTNHLRAFDLNHNPFPDEHIIPVLKLFPHVVYLNSNPIHPGPPSEDDNSDTESEWGSSVATTDLDSTTDSDLDWHEFENIPACLPALSRFMAWS